MISNDLYVKCLSEHYRFSLQKDGKVYTLSVEDLFDLSLNDLDSIYTTLSDKLNSKSNGKSLLNDMVDNETIILSDCMDIVEDIFNFKETEKLNRENQLLVNEKRQKIMKLISDKEDESLRDCSIDELKDMLNGL